MHYGFLQIFIHKLTKINPESIHQNILHTLCNTHTKRKKKEGEYTLTHFSQFSK